MPRKPQLPRLSDTTIDQWFIEIKKDLAEFNETIGFIPGSSLERTSWLLFLGFATQDTRLIHRFTGWPKEWIAPRADRARDYHIWVGQRTIAAELWFDSPECDLQFMMDVMIVDGIMMRTKKNKKYYYQMTESGLLTKLIQ